MIPAINSPAKILRNDCSFGAASGTIPISGVAWIEGIPVARMVDIVVAMMVGSTVAVGVVVDVEVSVEVGKGVSVIGNVGEMAG